MSVLCRKSQSCQHFMSRSQGLTSCDWWLGLFLSLCVLRACVCVCAVSCSGGLCVTHGLSSSLSASCEPRKPLDKATCLALGYQLSMGGMVNSQDPTQLLCRRLPQHAHSLKPTCSHAWALCGSIVALHSRAPTPCALTQTKVILLELCSLHVGNPARVLFIQIKEGKKNCEG